MNVLMQSLNLAAYIIDIIVKMTCFIIALCCGSVIPEFISEGKNIMAILILFIGLAFGYYVFI